MKLLLENNYLSEEQRLNFNSMTNLQKRKWIEKWLYPKSRARERDWLRSADSVLIDSLIEDGFDDIDNPYLNYIVKMAHLKKPISITLDAASLIRTLLDKNKLEPEEEWLYNSSLYEGHTKEVLYKIKALTFASNYSAQSDLPDDQKLEPTDFMSKGGVIKSPQEINNILSGIRVDDKRSQRRPKETSTKKDKITNWDVINNILKQSGKKTLKDSEDLIDYALDKVRNYNKLNGPLTASKVETFIDSEENIYSKAKLASVLKNLVVKEYKSLGNEFSTGDVDVAMIDAIYKYVKDNAL